jgi:hypothetical protein
VPTWTKERAFHVEVINMSKSRECLDEELPSNFRIGIGLDLKEARPSREVQHTLPVPSSLRESAKKTIQLRGKHPTHQLSISILLKQDSMEERMDNYLYSYRPIMTLSEPVLDQDLRGSTIYVLFQGLHNDIPLDVIVVTDDSLKSGPLFLVLKYAREMRIKVINSLMNLLL